MKPAPMPIADTWRAMEGLIEAGLVRNIGVCNFGVSLLRDMLSYAEVRPAVLQVEMHPYLAQQKLLRFCHENQINVTAFSPLGAASYYQIGMATPDESVLDQPVVRHAAERHGRTPAQVVLRWGVQRGTAVIPKTSRPERLKENLAVFDFELTDRRNERQSPPSTATAASTTPAFSARKLSTHFFPSTNSKPKTIPNRLAATRSGAQHPALNPSPIPHVHHDRHHNGTGPCRRPTNRLRSRLPARLPLQDAGRDCRRWRRMGPALTATS